MIANIALCLAFAAFCMAAIDALLIDMHKSIVHSVRGAIRIILGLGLVVALVLCSVAGWWEAAGMVIGSAAGFSIVFRWALNAMRMKHPSYMGLGAWYDRFWLNIGRKLLKNPAYGGWLAYIAESLMATGFTAYFTLH